MQHRRRRSSRRLCGPQLLCRDSSEGDEDHEENELLHGPDVIASINSALEVSGDLVAPSAFKAAGRSDPATAGSIPVHLRHHSVGPEEMTVETRQLFPRDGGKWGEGSPTKR